MVEALPQLQRRYRRRLSPDVRGNICEGLSAGYRIFNLNASYTFVIKRVAHVLSLSGQNLNDKLYRNDLSFIKAIAPEMGGTVRLNYTLRF